MKYLLQRKQDGPVSPWVHDVVIRGNNKPKDYIIDSEAEALKSSNAHNAEAGASISHSESEVA